MAGHRREVKEEGGRERERVSWPITSTSFEKRGTKKGKATGCQAALPVSVSFLLCAFVSFITRSYSPVVTAAHLHFRCTCSLLPSLQLFRFFSHPAGESRRGPEGSPVSSRTIVRTFENGSSLFMVRCKNSMWSFLAGECGL